MLNIEWCWQNMVPMLSFQSRGPLHVTGKVKIHLVLITDEIDTFLYRNTPSQFKIMNYLA